MLVLAHLRNVARVRALSDFLFERLQGDRRLAGFMA